MSLRTRLLAASLTLVVLGLLVADVATYRALRSFLYARVDDQLEAAHGSLVRAVVDPRGPMASQAVLQQLGTVAPGVYVQVRNSADEVVVTIEGRGPGAPAMAPALPGEIVSLVPEAQAPGDLVGRTRRGDRVATERPAADDASVRQLTVDYADGDGPGYRLRISALPGGGAIVMGLPLDDAAATLRRLVRIEVLVTAAVVVAAAAVGAWLVRLGLRPLGDIEDTAAKITAGDLTHRVQRVDDTEVGRLGGTLNVMLDHLDEAFAERQASEEAARASEQKARASEQKVRRFVADASHELRTPVAAVRAYSELYRRGADQHPEDLARVLARVESEAERMGVLVDELLLLTRLDEGRGLERRPVDLGALAAEAVAAAQVLEPDRPISLAVEGSVEVLGDRIRLRQVVDNLLANVRAHTPAGAPADVTVAAVEAEGGGRGDQGDRRVARLDVADRGPGVDGDAAQLFERFYRADPSRSRDRGGSGLGLSIVAAIVAAHGGQATASPREGGGAVFSLRLPLLESEEGGEPASPPSPLEASPPESSPTTY